MMYDMMTRARIDELTLALTIANRALNISMDENERMRSRHEFMSKTMADTNKRQRDTIVALDEGQENLYRQIRASDKLRERLTDAARIVAQELWWEGSSLHANTLRDAARNWGRKTDGELETFPEDGGPPESERDSDEFYDPPTADGSPDIGMDWDLGSPGDSTEGGY